VLELEPALEEDADDSLFDSDVDEDEESEDVDVDDDFFDELRLSVL
jgi:hypothetical protein